MQITSTIQAAMNSGPKKMMHYLLCRNPIINSYHQNAILLKYSIHIFHLYTLETSSSLPQTTTTNYMTHLIRWPQNFKSSLLAKFWLRRKIILHEPLERWIEIPVEAARVFKITSCHPWIHLRNHNSMSLQHRPI